ncbi:MAG TPA: NADH-quinone oxidoreductase subunit NuoF [Coriobacteriia bacterium]
MTTRETAAPLASHEPDGMLAGATTIRICTGSGCVMSGSLVVAERVESAIAEAGAGDRVRVVRTGCDGLCELGPLTVIDPRGTFYPKVTEHQVERIVDSILAGGAPVTELLYRDHTADAPIERYADLPFNRSQQHIVLRNCGVIDPEDIEHAIERGVYDGLRTALTSMSPDRVIAQIQASGLRGRGGAGFSTGLKWRFTRDAAGDGSGQKYVICNADEGDPGAFMDRGIAEGDPHSVLEGLAIAAYAVGATHGFVYVRSEYPLAVKRFRMAIAAATKHGFLGDDVFGSGFCFNAEVREGAGAFVCGEETALIASIEGRRGTPRTRPPFPAQSGLWGRPTCINNVETLANVPWIITHGADEYTAMGSGTSRGTKVFALTGKVRHSGLVEVPFGLSVRELVETIGGGTPDGSPAKAVQFGGPSGGCLPESLFDTPIEYETLAAVGAIVGSGGVVVVDGHTCMVDLARFFLSFTQKESCGKCVPCRIGTKRMLEIVTRICEGDGAPGDLDTLEQLARDVGALSLCGLGQTAPNPVLTSLRYFRHEYEEHILEHKCRAGACKRLSTFRIVSHRCIGCGVCKKYCPTDAISGTPKLPHLIDQALCIKCGACQQRCPSDAIERS